MNKLVLSTITGISIVGNKPNTANGRMNETTQGVCYKSRDVRDITKYLFTLHYVLYKGNKVNLGTAVLLNRVACICSNLSIQMSYYT